MSEQRYFVRKQAHPHERPASLKAKENEGTRIIIHIWGRRENGSQIPQSLATSVCC